MSITTAYEALHPELRLALLAACEASNPTERGQQRVQRWRSRLAVSLGGVAVLVGAIDAILLLAS